MGVKGFDTLSVHVLVFVLLSAWALAFEAWTSDDGAWVLSRSASNALRMAAKKLGTLRTYSHNN